MLATLLFFGLAAAGFGAEPGWKTLHGHVPAAVAHLTPNGRVPATNQLALAIGLPLRNQTGLDELIAQLYDPRSTNYHKYLTPEEFAARFGPTEQDYQAVIQFAETNGLTVTGRHGNRVVLDVAASAASIGHAFKLNLRTYRHPREARDFFAPDAEPSVPTNLPVADMWGLSDYARPTPLARPQTPPVTRPLNWNGSSSDGSYRGTDFRNAYIPGSGLVGSGQTVAIVEFDGYYPTDITAYEAECGYTNVPLQNVLLNSVSGTPGYSGVANADFEVSLDIETAIAMAPGLSNVIVYEGSNPYDVFNRVATDRLAKQVSCSWYWDTGPSSIWHGFGSTLDSQLKQMVTQGQAFFTACGDADAYTGSQAITAAAGPIPVDSIYTTSVGGTSLTMNSGGASWSSETVWNWGGDVGTGGGISSNYTIPSWQTNVSMAANSGSTVYRNFPDVALTAEAVHVDYGYGVSGPAAGTSCAAPLWAGFCALANQLAVATNGTGLGFLNPALYKLAASSCYANCFHDITTGNNTANTASGLFNAVPGFDLCTGLGTPNGTNLINALVWPPPTFVTQPANKNATNGANVSLSVTVSGPAPFGYAWLFNGTNLSDGGSLSGSASNVLSFVPATTNNSGSYQLVVSNLTGAVTSSVAVLNIGFVPLIAALPTNQIVFSGSNAVFAATVTGSTPLVYHWRKNGTNLVNGTGVSGATNSVLTLTAVTTNSGGNFNLSVSNIFGVATSSVTALTVVLPPVITSSSVTNRTSQCGSNNLAFSFTATGTAPLKYQWSLDGSPVANATNTSFALTNLHLPNHTVSVTVTNLYASLTSNAVLTVQDTLAPVITRSGSNLLYLELGSAFTDPGVTATDLCAGAVGVIVSGAVNVNVVGTNTLTYLAGDGSGNTNTTTRTVIVRDTTPPTILWSFTNLVLAADTNCSAKMPCVTGTNFILATDLSGALTISQSPTNNTVLFLGTNSVVITVKDASGNTTHATNQIVVQDQTPPVITLNGGSLIFSELGQAFADPGAAALDACAGIVVVAVSGGVNSNVIGTNTLTYTADDGRSNTNTAARTVIVRDTTPPTILWSFTNLVLAADTNCSAALPDVTGTNFVLAADLSGLAAISQTPTNGSVLLLGTNLVVLAVPDIFGNTVFSTNTIMVQDQLPPVIASQPQSQTNNAGDTASFSVAATACTPLAFQWFFGAAALVTQTNSTLTLSNLNSSAAGNYFVVTTAAGGATTSAVVALTVNLLFTSVTLASSENPSGFNDGVNFTATVTPANASGTIQFLTNGAFFDAEIIFSGQAVSTNLSALPRGTNVIAAIYSGGMNDLPATNLLLQIVTNHPPVAVAVLYTNTGDAPLAIDLTNLATNWSDVDGDVVSLADVSISTNGITLINNGTALIYSNSNNVADQFTCTITDGWGGTNFQSVSIAPVPVANPTPLINGVAAAGNGVVTLNLGGAPGGTYVLETAADLSATGGWLPVATNTLDSSGIWQFTDAQATNFIQRFYRLKLAQ